MNLIYENEFYITASSMRTRAGPSSLKMCSHGGWVPIWTCEGALCCTVLVLSVHPVTLHTAGLQQRAVRRIRQ